MMMIMMMSEAKTDNEHSKDNRSMYQVLVRQ